MICDRQWRGRLQMSSSGWKPARWQSILIGELDRLDSHWLLAGNPCLTSNREAIQYNKYIYYIEYIYVALMTGLSEARHCGALNCSLAGDEAATSTAALLVPVVNPTRRILVIDEPNRQPQQQPRLDLPPHFLTRDH
jgi:hypothetical protein